MITPIRRRPDAPPLKSANPASGKSASPPVLTAEQVKAWRDDPEVKAAVQYPKQDPASGKVIERVGEDADWSKDGRRQQDAIIEKFAKLRQHAEASLDGETLIMQPMDTRPAPPKNAFEGYKAMVAAFLETAHADLQKKVAAIPLSIPDPSPPSDKVLVSREAHRAIAALMNCIEWDGDIPQIRYQGAAFRNALAALRSELEGGE